MAAPDYACLLRDAQSMCPPALLVCTKVTSTSASRQSEVNILITYSLMDLEDEFLGTHAGVGPLRHGT